MNKKLTLDEAVKAIHAKFAEEEDAGRSARLACGQMLLALRKLIEAGEAGRNVQWWQWYKTKFERSRKDAERIMRIAAAPNPQKAEEGKKPKLGNARASIGGAERTYAPATQ